MKKQPDRFALIIFGITGNLSQIKLIPALYDLAAAHLIPEGMTIVGVGRKQMDEAAFRTYVSDILATPNRHHQHPIDSGIRDRLLDSMKYVTGDFSDPVMYESIKNILKASGCNNRMFYMATYPELYGTIFTHLVGSGLSDRSCGWARILVEKPLGTDLTTAKELNKLLSRFYEEDQIYRLDHYLGKETLQNILTFRFGNGIFEPMMNSEYVDHIQVTATEDFGVGLRGGYYDTVGALKDVGQNHLLQMIALATMDAPADLSNPAITAKRIEALRRMVPEPDRVVFGQYRGYTKEKFVDPGSIKDTYFAFRTHLSAGRLAGVPIYVRGGKMLKRWVTEIAVVFKVPISRLFRNIPGGNDSNILIYRIQPNEGIVLRMMTKRFGSDLALDESYMQFCYRQNGIAIPDAYLRLLSDALKGDQTFFIDGEEAEVEWAFSDPLSAAASKPETYEPGSWGPASADDLMKKDGRQWLEPSVAFCAL